MLVRRRGQRGVPLLLIPWHSLLRAESQTSRLCSNTQATFLSLFFTGVVVNGQLIGAKKAENKKLNTYFGKIGFYFKTKGLKVEINTETITLKDGSYSIALTWSDTGHIIRKQ